MKPTLTDRIIRLMTTYRQPLWLRTTAWMLLASLAVTTGCISNKRLVYVQDEAQKANGSPISYETPLKPYKLQTGDVLSVTVKGVDQELQNTFNTTSGGFGGAMFSDPANMYANGYSIDESGDITVTSVGKVRVKGLTVNEAQELVQKRIANFLREATVSVKLVSFKVTVLGEVKRAGYYYVTNQRCNLMEAIGLGGDLTNIADRQNVKLIRQTDKGSEVVVLDITDANLIRSPYYNLQPNDVLYVAPLRGQTAAKNFTPTTVALGIISGIATLTLLTLTLRESLN